MILNSCMVKACLESKNNYIHKTPLFTWSIPLNKVGLGGSKYGRTRVGGSGLERGEEPVMNRQINKVVVCMCVSVGVGNVCDGDSCR